MAAAGHAYGITRAAPGIILLFVVPLPNRRDRKFNKCPLTHLTAVSCGLINRETVRREPPLPETAGPCVPRFLNRDFASAAKQPVSLTT